MSSISYHKKFKCTIYLCRNCFIEDVGQTEINEYYKLTKLLTNGVTDD